MYINWKLKECKNSVWFWFLFLLTPCLLFSNRFDLALGTNTQNDHFFILNLICSNFFLLNSLEFFLSVVHQQICCCSYNFKDMMWLMRKIPQNFNFILSPIFIEFLSFDSLWNFLSVYLKQIWHNSYSFHNKRDQRESKRTNIQNVKYFISSFICVLFLKLDFLGKLLCEVFQKIWCSFYSFKDMRG